MNAVLWTEQYRPRQLDEVIGQDAVKDFLKRIIRTGAQKAPHIILHGPPGTGKTSMAMAFANDMYPGLPFKTKAMYLNASDERTMETVRERICEFLRICWNGVQRKIVIFDEVETMTEPAQLTLRALMDSALGNQEEDPPLFLFLCNTLARIVPTVRSRALALFCAHLTATQIRGLITDIQVREGRPVCLPTPLACLIHRGDMRSFMQRAQQGQDSNHWLPWLQRLMNAPIDRVAMVWEDGEALAPRWLLIRHLLVFCYALGIPNSLPAAVWSDFLEVVVSRPGDIVRAWQTIRANLT